MASYATRKRGARQAVVAARRYEAEVVAWQNEQAAAVAERINARIAEEAARDAAAPRDLAGLQPGDAVRDRFGWHRVVRVNAKSVTVATEYSWTETIPHAKVIETRTAVPA